MPDWNNLLDYPKEFPCYGSWAHGIASSSSRPQDFTVPSRWAFLAAKSSSPVGYACERPLEAILVAAASWRSSRRCSPPLHGRARRQKALHIQSLKQVSKLQQYPDGTSPTAPDEKDLFWRNLMIISMCCLYQFCRNFELMCCLELSYHRT